MKKLFHRASKGFTLAELLIVVAIIGVLVAIAIPIFSTQLEKSREQTDIANLRSAKAAAAAMYLDNNEAAGVYAFDAQKGILVTDASGISAYGRGTAKQGGSASFYMAEGDDGMYEDDFDATDKIIIATIVDTDSGENVKLTWAPVSELPELGVGKGQPSADASDPATNPEPVNYTFTYVSGIDEWGVCQGNSMVVSSAAPLDKFVEVRVDGNTLANRYYTATSGSTIITFDKGYLDAVERDVDHTIEIVSTDGSATGTFYLDGCSDSFVIYNNNQDELTRFNFDPTSASSFEELADVYDEFRINDGNVEFYVFDGWHQLKHYDLGSETASALDPTSPLEMYAPDAADRGYDAWEYLLVCDTSQTMSYSPYYIEVQVSGAINTTLWFTSANIEENDLDMLSLVDSNGYLAVTSDYVTCYNLLHNGAMVRTTDTVFEGMVLTTGESFTLGEEPEYNHFTIESSDWPGLSSLDFYGNGWDEIAIPEGPVWGFEKTASAVQLIVIAYSHDTMIGWNYYDLYLNDTLVDGSSPYENGDHYTAVFNRFVAK